MKLPSPPVIDLDPVLSEVVPTYRTLSSRQLSGLTVLIFDSLSGSRRHWHNRSDESADFFSKSYLRTLLGNDYVRALDPVFERPIGRHGYSQRSGKRSVFREEVAGHVSRYLQETAGAPLIDPWTKRPVLYPLGRMRSALYASDVHGKPAKSRMPQVSPLVEVDVPSLLTYAEVLREQLDRWTPGHLFEGPSGRSLTRGQVEVQLRQCVLLVTLARADQGGPGRVVQLYREHRNGRLVGVGPHLQMMSREVRAVALGNQGLTDWDLEAAHPKTLYHLAKDAGYDAGGIREYVENKTEVRRSVARELNVPIDAVKTGFTSISYGTQRSTSPMGSLYRTFGGDRRVVRRFLDHPNVSVLFRERQVAMERVLGASTYVRGCLRNDMGKLKPTRTGWKKVSPWSLLSHRLTGVEALAAESGIREVVDSGGYPLLLCFDGWMSSGSVSRSRVQDSILEATGIPLTLTRTEVPHPDSFLD